MNTTETTLVGTFDGVKVYRIPGYPRIAVSKCGKVWRFGRQVARKKGGNYGTKPKWAKITKSKDRCVVGTGEKKQIQRVHRLMGLAFLGVTADLEVDHIDGDPLNNTLSNLRAVTHFENMHNIKGRGYSWDKRDEKWCAMMYVRGKNISLGRFGTKEEARAAYVKAKKELGVVFPESGPRTAHRYTGEV